MQRIPGVGPILVLAMLAGCGNSLRDDRFATGSSTLVSSRDHSALLAVNVDESSVTRLDPRTGDTLEVQVGAEPSRIAAVGRSEYWVTLRGERAVAILEEDGGSLRKVGSLSAGAEPYGIVASENGKRVYVAMSQSDEVVEYDGRSREPLRTFSIPDEPKWLALHPGGDVLYVASAKLGTLSAVDLRDGGVHDIPLPQGQRLDMDRELFDLDFRISGDPSVLPDGTELAVPTLFVDTETSVEDPETPEEPVQNGYGSSGFDVSRLNPSLVIYDLKPDGMPRGDSGRAVLLAAVTFGRKETTVFRSYPSSVTAAPTSDEWVVTMEGSDAVLVVSREDSHDRGMSTDVAMTEMAPGTEGQPMMPITPAAEGGFETHPITAVQTGAGPRGVAFSQEDEAYAHAWLDRAVGSLRYPVLEDDIEEIENEGFVEGSREWRQVVTMAQSALPPEIEAGRRLFYSALDGRMAGAGAGVSCATCHADGRNDGFTWTLQGQPRQTPALVGPVDQTAPVTWTNEVDSVATEAQLTTSLRMGGLGLSDTEAGQIQAFVVAQRYPDVRRAGEASDLVELGREVFERAEVGCAGCHSGSLLTDNQRHLVLGGEATQTPTLRGIAATAPYLHDGSLPNLASLVRWARDGKMGDTSSLSEHELDALVAYLESL
jgi:DNA-binding beta-propeller fold protein YncE/mono/diheme cytochrome c family protein